MESYRKVLIVDEENKPLRGVNRFPMEYYGKGSKLSDSKGEIWVPKQVFYFLKNGFQRLDVSNEMQDDDRFMMKAIEDSP